MDARTEPGLPAPIVVTGAGCHVRSRVPCPGAAWTDAPVDSSAWLKNRKMRKFMGKQDHLAVIAACQAAKAAGADDTLLRERTGVYLCVGYIPFDRADIEPLSRNSTRDGQFSMELYSTVALQQVNPLLTFRCLPNMPIFHVSLNLGIQGPYFITYPGPGQFYLALQEALAALQRGEIDLALLGAVADQDNFLVDWHFRRQRYSSAWTCADAAAFLCLEARAHAARRSARVLGEYLSASVEYEPHDPLKDTPIFTETLRLAGSEVPLDQAGYLGPASLPAPACWLLARGQAGELRHELRSADGIVARSDWRLLG